MDQQIIFDQTLIKKYDISGPRYTSYPTARQFVETFTEDEYIQHAKASNGSHAAPLSIYIHIPFCDTVCFYCACNKIATKDRSKGQPYLDRLFKEIEMQSQLFDRDRSVKQLHWGGGTPTFISHEEIQKLMEKTRQHFNFASDDEGEFSIEVDPREATHDTIALLRKVGFNRLSMGVQDFDPIVQKAVNRIQPKQQTFDVYSAAREQGFKSISMDLIYGLPFQNAKSFENTLNQTIEISPDRISLFNYAHLPHIFKPQRRINQNELPSTDEKLIILKQSIQQLTEAGYQLIGMDHFAKANDEMVKARNEGKLHRNFQGYSTHADCDMVSMGVTSISQINNIYSQNQHDLEKYYHGVDEGHLPVQKGVILNQDDLLRRDVIHSLMCHFQLPYTEIENKYGIQFVDYFQAELAAMTDMQHDELVTIEQDHIQVMPKGQLLIRNIAMMFDQYLKQAYDQNAYSKAI